MSEQTPAKLSGERKNVLVVDDDPLYQKTLAQLLSRLNFSVTTASGGREALNLLNIEELGDLSSIEDPSSPSADNSPRKHKHSKFDLILVDVVMPDIDGLKLIRILKKAFASDIPIIMCSSSEQPDVQKASFAGGALDFLQKPVKFEILKKRVEAVMSFEEQKRVSKKLREQLEHQRLKKENLESKIKIYDEKIEEMRSIIGTKQTNEKDKNGEQNKPVPAPIVSASRRSSNVEIPQNEGPIQEVFEIIGQLLNEGENADDAQVRTSLFAILKVLGTSKNLYAPDFDLFLNDLKSNDDSKGSSELDETTKKWLESEFFPEAKNRTRLMSMDRKPSSEAMIASTSLAEAHLGEIQTETNKEGEEKRFGPYRPQLLSSEDLRRGSIPNTVEKKLDLQESIKQFKCNTRMFSENEFIIQVVYMFNSLGLKDFFNLDEEKLINFLKFIKTQYSIKNPYHNFAHILDCTQFIYVCLLSVELNSVLSPLDKLAILIAVLIHDIAHPGLNNNYLIATKHDLAIIYNDNSPLEMHHISVGWKILMKQEFNFVSQLSKASLKALRSKVIGCVLATDMKLHFEIISKFETRVSSGAPKTKTNKDGGSDPIEIQLILNILMKAADISNVVRPFDIARSWAESLLEENFLQGDVEKKKGLPVSTFMDRKNTDLYGMQLKFYDYIAAPLYKPLGKYFPSFQCLHDQLTSNRFVWQQKAQDEKMRKELIFGEYANYYQDISASEVQEQAAFYINSSGKKVPTILPKIKGVSLLYAEISDEIAELFTKRLDESYFPYSRVNSLETLTMMSKEKKFDALLLPISFPSVVQTCTFFRKMFPKQDIILYSNKLEKEKEKEKLQLINELQNTLDNKFLLFFELPIHAFEFVLKIHTSLQNSINRGPEFDKEYAISMLLDEDFLAEVLPQFLADSESKAIALMCTLLEAPELDYAEIELHAHSLKGSSAQMGAKKLSNASMEMESLAKEHSTRQKLSESLARIKTKFASLKQEVDNYLASR